MVTLTYKHNKSTKKAGEKTLTKTNDAEDVIQETLALQALTYLMANNSRSDILN